MISEWHRLTDLTGKKDFVVSQVKLKKDGITIGGEFELPLLARLPYEEQVFVGEFIRSHGSIKHMEKAFGVSYPTIKARLNRISKALQLVEVEAPAERQDALELLAKGEITAEEAIERLKQ